MVNLGLVVCCFDIVFRLRLGFVFLFGGLLFGLLV